MQINIQMVATSGEALFTESIKLPERHVDNPAVSLIKELLAMHADTLRKYFEAAAE